MKILFHSTSTNNVYHVIGSLHSLGGHEVEVAHYDERWNESCMLAVQSNPDVRQYLQAGRFDLVGIPRERARSDEEMIRKAENFRPDIQIYISAWEGLFVPEDETLVKLNAIAPLVHFCFDQSDPPWWEGDENHGNVIRYHEKGCFSLQVGIDGGHNWPGGKDWKAPLYPGKPLFDGLTLLTPIDPRPFEIPTYAFSERPYKIGYAGNAGGDVRSMIVERMKHELKGGAIHLRDDNPHSYVHYARFLKLCRLVIDVPFTGSTRAKHVKGRLVEAGYAGTPILTWGDNAAVRSWFTPRHEFEEYGTIEECIEMAQWLSDRPRRCAEMGDALRRRVLEEHSPSVFWRKVFERVPVKPAAIEPVAQAAAD